MFRMLLIAAIDHRARTDRHERPPSRAETEPSRRTHPSARRWSMTIRWATSTGGTPDIVACGVSEPWESLLSFRLEFASEPPLSYDMETWTTDELWVVLSTPAGATVRGRHRVRARSSTEPRSPQEEDTARDLFDTTAARG